MNTNPPLIEAAAAASWKDLIEPTKPERPWALICAKEVEIADAHRNAVKCHFETDFDLDKALFKISKVNRADWLDSTVKYQQKLGDYLRQWARTNVG